MTAKRNKASVKEQFVSGIMKWYLGTGKKTFVIKINKTRNKIKDSDQEINHI
jgi:hypothetical protein